MKKILFVLLLLVLLVGCDLFNPVNKKTHIWFVDTYIETSPNKTVFTTDSITYTFDHDVASLISESNYNVFSMTYIGDVLTEVNVRKTELP